MMHTFFQLYARLLTLCAILGTVIGTALVLAMVIGGQLPHTSNPLGFNRCRLPCYAGITPGATDVREARRLLALLTESQGSAESLNSGKWVYSTAVIQILLTTDFQRATRLDVDSIQQPALIRLGDALLMLGDPARVYAIPASVRGNYTLILTYNTSDYGVYLLFRIGRQLSPETAADSVKIYKLSSGTIPLFPPNQGHAWHGFGWRSLG